jgi:hypothetical protein
LYAFFEKRAWDESPMPRDQGGLGEMLPPGFWGTVPM